jgi:methyl acetate hydrolase
MAHGPLSRRALLVGATAAAAASSVKVAPAFAASPNSAALANVDQALGSAVQAKAVPHIVAVAATPGGTLYEGSFGTQSIGEGAAVTPESVYWIASMTKAITGTAAMQQVERGALRLDQPMGKLLPELEKVQVLDGFDQSGQPKLRAPTRPITLRHLLTHTAGFVYSIWDDNMLKYEKVTGTPFIGECKNASFNAPIMFDPGERWEYGINMDWVGKAVEAVSDQSLEIYFRENIFTPLGMPDTGFLINTPQKARTAMMYNRGQDGTLVASPFEMPQRPEFFMGGGALFSTPRDYMQFLQMLLNNGRFNGVQVLKPETVAAMMQNHIGDLNVVTLKTVQPALSKDANFFPDQPEQKWGLSFDINTAQGPNGRSPGSICWAGLFNTYFWLDPTTKVTGTIMTQMLPFADDQVLKLYGQFEQGVYDEIKT